MAQPLTPAHAAELKREIDRAMAVVLAAAAEVPACQEAIPAMIELGHTLLALETLKRHLP